jgi:hypothetical protein
LPDTAVIERLLTCRGRGTAQEIVASCDELAFEPPSLLTGWAVKTRVVEVPTASVRVRVTV